MIELQICNSIIGQFLKKLPDDGVANLQLDHPMITSRGFFLEKLKKPMIELQICNSIIGQFLKKLSDDSVASFVLQFFKN